MAQETTLEFCEICGAEVEMPADTLKALTEGPDKIGTALREAPTGKRHGWTPAEVATHLADTEVVSGWRIRQILAENEPDIQPYDQDKWATALHYGERDVNLALEAFVAARRANVEILRLLAENDWERTYVHEEYGRLTLRQKVRHLSDHDLTHQRQIRSG